MARLAELATGAPVMAANARFFAIPLPVIFHIVSVIPFSLLGALQFSPALRRHRPGWHRATGRVLVILGMVAALTGLWMTLDYPWPAGDGEILYLLRVVFGSAMAIAIVLAVDAIRRHDFAAHGAWMIRGYAIAMGAGTQVLTHMPYYLLVGKPGELTRAVLMGAGWVINVIAAEWIIRKGAAPRLRHAPASDQTVGGARNICLYRTVVSRIRQASPASLSGPTRGGLILTASGPTPDPLAISARSTIPSWRAGQSMTHIRV
jgi:uncharacterized membrane protein